MAGRTCAAKQHGGRQVGGRRPLPLLVAAAAVTAWVLATVAESGLGPVFVLRGSPRGAVAGPSLRAAAPGPASSTRRAGRVAAAAAATQVHVVDGHGDALKYWEALPEASYRVLHVDSHADMFLDFRPTPSSATSAGEYHQELGEQVHLSNFIPLGILGGKVESVVWVRSDFPGCRYNGPPPGEYQLSVGRPADIGDPNSPALCYWQRGGGSFRQYSFVADPLQGGYDFMGDTDGWPKPERNRWWEKVPYLLEEFGLYLLGEPMGTPFAPPADGVERPFNFAVVTDTQLNAEEGAGVDFMEKQVGGGPWILDVDLDFFATLAPALAPAVRRLQLTPAEANGLGQWSQALSGAVQMIEEEDPGSQAFRLPLLMETVQGLLDLGSSASAEDVVDVVSDVDPRAMPMPEDFAEHIASALRGLSEADRAVWPKLSEEEWDELIASPHGPHFVASPEGVAEAAAGLQRVLAGLLDRGLPPPAAVTIARSTDLYLPLDLGPLIEEEMLAVLKRLGWMPAGEAPAERPVWPEGTVGA